MSGEDQMMPLEEKLAEEEYSQKSEYIDTESSNWRSKDKKI